ncbi:MAG: acylphosphatase [Candidatus Kerfeldbacteria bacterium]|nr:acylphosphatase [Candidatus Kerfeldbacteria bacterium]
MRRRCHLRLKGEVQGVGLRGSCRLKAWWLGLGGWVRNEPDGTVRLVIEGEERQVARFIAWLQTGYSRLNKLEVEDQPATGEKSFAILYK